MAWRLRANSRVAFALALWPHGAPPRTPHGHALRPAVSTPLPPTRSSCQVIFPPLTMLRVMPHEPVPASLPPRPALGAPADAMVEWSRLKHQVAWERTEAEQDFERIVVKPTFTG